LLIGNPSSGCSSFAAHYSFLSKFNPKAPSISAIFRSSKTSSFDSFVKYVNIRCFTPIEDNSSNTSYASCVLVIDDVHLPVETQSSEISHLGNIHEVIRSLVQLNQFVMPVTSAKQSRLWKSDGKSFLQRNSSHLRLMATATRSSLETGADTRFSAIPFARLLWNDATSEIIQHIFKTTMQFCMFHISNFEAKTCLDDLTSETMCAMSFMHNKSVMSDRMIFYGSEDISRINFVRLGEDINIEFKKGRVSGLRKRVKVEKKCDEGSRYKLLLLIGAEAGAATTQYVISSVHLGIPPGWDKAATPCDFYFNLEKSETVVCESERSKDWVSGVNLMFDGLKTTRECIDEEWKCASQERLPLGVTFDLRRLGTVMTCLSVKCATTKQFGSDDLWMWWQAALLQSFSMDRIAVDLLQKTVEASNRLHTCNRFDFLNDCESSSQVRKKQWCAKTDYDFRKMLMNFPSVSVNHLRLLNACPSIMQFTENLATSLKCQRVIVECSLVDVTSAAVVATACESLGIHSVIFSNIHATMQNVFNDGRPSFMSVPADQLILQSLHECLRICVKCVCSDRLPAVLIMTAKELAALTDSLSTIYQVLDDGDCSELFSAGEISSLASDAEEKLELGKKFNLSSALLQKLKVENNGNAVEELQEYDHAVPLFGLGREVLGSVSFFFGSTAARGRVCLGKNAMGGNARSDAVLHAKLTNDIKFIVLTESKNDINTNSFNVDNVKSWMNGDVVSVKLPSLSSLIFFKEILGLLFDETKSQEFLTMTSDIYDEGFLKSLGPSEVVQELLTNCYACVIPFLANIDACAPYQFLAQFKLLYESKLHENENSVKEFTTIADVTLKQMQLKSLYQKREEALLQTRQIARSDLENVFKNVVSHSAHVSRHEHSLREQEKSVSDLRMKLQQITTYNNDFSTYCEKVSVDLQASDFLSLMDADLDVNQKLILDAAALILSVSLCGCVMLVSTNGQLLHSPSHPSSLSKLIDLQDQDALGNCVARLGLQSLNPETIELLLPITEAISLTGQKQQTRLFRLLNGLISRYVSEYESTQSKHQHIEFQETTAAEAIAMSHLQHLKRNASMLQQQLFIMNSDLDDKMKTYQQIEKNLSTVQSFISRISSMIIGLRSWTDAKSQQISTVSENDQQEPMDDGALSQTSLSWTENEEARCACLRQSAGLAAFIMFGGLLDSESRFKFLRCLQGIETFFSCDRMNAAMQDVNSIDTCSYDFVNGVSDDATQLMWQQCGIPAHPELLISVSLTMASAKTPFVMDSTGVAIEFLRSMSLCNHSTSHDNEELMSQLDSNSNEEHVGVLIQSRRRFPAFVKSCPAAAVCTAFGKVPSAGCVIVTLPDSNFAIDKVASACNDGCMLIIRIPAHESQSSASMLCLNAFLPLLSLPKLRQDVQTIKLLGRILVVSVKFSCFVVSEGDWFPREQLHPLLSIVQFTPGYDVMQQLLLRAHASHNSKGLLTSFCVLQQRFLSFVVKIDSIKIRLLDELDVFSSFVTNMHEGDYTTDTAVSSDQRNVIFSHNLDKIEECLEIATQTKVAMLRVQSLMRQTNTSLAELLPHTLQYGPSLALAAASCAANVSTSNLYQDFFSLLHSAFTLPAATDSSTSRRTNALKTPGPGTNAAARIFRALCCLIPQNIRLSIAICALKHWMGGDDGLSLLLHAPMPSSPLPKNLIKIQQTLASTSNMTAAAPIIGFSKSIPNPPKKPGKSSTPITVATSVMAPENAPTHVSHMGPIWMPIEQYTTLKKVVAARCMLYDNACECFQYTIFDHLNLLQYAIETQARGLLAAQQEMIGDESSEWRSWYLGQQLGSVLPPSTISVCSTYEKLVIVQM
jgi:hypothetical protein